MALQMLFCDLFTVSAGDEMRIVLFLNITRPNSGHGQVSVSRTTMVIREGAT